MLRRRFFLLLIGLSFLLSTGAIAQTPLLSITGTVTDVKPAGPGVIKNCRWERTETYFEVRIRLQYRNHGDIPLIVPRPNFFDGKKQLLFLELPVADSKVAATPEEWFFQGGRDMTPLLIEQLQMVEPPGKYFAIIGPGSSYETGEMINLKSGYKLEIIRQGPPKHDVELANPEHPYFKVRYTRSFKDRREGSDLLADAGRRWSRVGKLVLNSQDDFFFESDVIINKLRELPFIGQQEESPKRPYTPNCLK